MLRKGKKYLLLWEEKQTWYFYTKHSVLNVMKSSGLHYAQERYGMHMAMIEVEGRAQSKRYALRHIRKVATEVAEQTDRGRLLQREGAQELNALVPVLVLILGTDRVIPLFDLGEHDGRKVPIKE